MWYSVLILSLLVFSIGFLKNLMDLLADVFNLLNEYDSFVGLRLNMVIIFLCYCKGWCNINGTQALESHPHLQGAMVGGAMQSPVVDVLNIWKLCAY